MSFSESCSRFSSGVPGIGIKALIGIDMIPNSASETAISSLSSQVSPIPIMPPEQTQKPSS